MTTRQTTEMRTSTRADKIETPTINVIKTTMVTEVVTSDRSIVSASTDAVTTEEQQHKTTSVTNMKETYTSEADKGISTTLHEVTTSKFTTMLGESSRTRTSEQPQSSSSSTIPTVKKPPDSQKSDDIPVEVIAPVASVAGIILICVIICIAVGIRRNGFVCKEDTLPMNTNLVDKVSVDIKNRERDTYVNPLYDDISLTGKSVSDRSDVDSMMQEIPSDEDDDDYTIPEVTKIDGELWTHL